MKTSNLMLLGATGLFAYFVLSKKASASGEDYSGNGGWGETGTYPSIIPMPSIAPTEQVNYGVGAAASNVIAAMNQGKISSNTKLAADWTPSTPTSLSNIGAVLNLNPANPNLFSDSVLAKIQATINKQPDSRYSNVYAKRKK
jgi:hypothetical protein